MDITVYKKLYEALEVALVEFNNQTNFGVSLSPYSPEEPKYPLIVMDEARNTPISKYTHNREEISSLGYRVDIFAKTALITKPDKKKEPFTKQQICREIMAFVDNFMRRRIGLEQISYNYFDSVGTQGELYQIVLVYQQKHNDKREYFF